MGIVGVPSVGLGLSEQHRLGGTAELDAAWTDAISGLKAGDFKAAKAHLKAVVRERKKLGIPNFFAMSDVVLRHASETADKGNSSEAVELVALAEAMAPWNPRVPLVRAELDYANQGLAPSGQIGWLHRSWALQLDHLPDRMILTGRMYAVGLLSILWAVVLFGLLMLVRHGPRLTHDAGHLLPAALRGPPIAVLGLVLLIVAPLTIGVGLTLMSLTWCVVLWAYLSTPERLVGVTLAILIALTPWLNGCMEAALAYPGTRAETTYECTYGRCNGPRRSALEEANGSGLASPEERRTLALSYKRQGSASGQSVLIYKAEQLLSKLIQDGDTSYATALNLANARLARGNLSCRHIGSPPKFEEVTAMYKEAAARIPEDGGVEVAFNQAMLLTQMGLPDKAAAAMKQATDIDRSRVDAWLADVDETEPQLCPDDFNANLVLMDVLPDRDQLRAQLNEGYDGKGRILAPFGYLLAGIVDAAFLPMLGIVCAVLLLLGGVLSKTMRPAYACAQCGRIACGRCRRELRALDLCERCLHLKIKGAFVDSRERWLRDRGISQGRSRRRLLSQILTFLLPGAGHMVRGRILLGVLTQWTFLFAVLYLFSATLLVPDSGLIGDTQLLIGIYATVAAVLAYVVAVVDILVRE